MSRSKRSSFLLCVVLLAVAAGACATGTKTPKEQILSGLSMTAWDVAQPVVPGAPDYAQDVARVVAEFEQRYGVKVDLKTVGRQDIVKVLSGKAPAGDVALTFSTEWPFAPANLPGVPGEVDAGAFLGAAAAYWTKDGNMLAIPAYVHWVSAVSASGATEGASGAAAPVYIPDSPAFLRSVMDYPLGGWDPDGVAAYIAWIRETYGPPAGDPLAAWKEGAARSVFPVTPYLYEWLRDSGGRPVTIAPEAGPQSEPSLYYTVPGYVVLAAEEPYRTCAARLGEALAANLGRWAARAIAGLPAAVADTAVFQVDSRLPTAERVALIQAFSAGDLHVPGASDFLYAESVEDAIRQSVSDFLSGKADEAELRESIREASGKHTKP